MNKKLLKKLLLILSVSCGVINVTNCDDSNRLQQNETPRGYIELTL